MNKEFEFVKDMPTKYVPKMGKVSIHLEYFVDLNNDDMVSYAKESLYEDVMSLIEHDEVFNAIDVEEDSKATYDDIPEFIKEYISDIESWEEE
jgi:hypothetical protein